MARPKGYDRDAVLRAARDLFWERGYEATSVADLEARTGLNRSSLYQEFGSKHGLFEAALECYADQVIARLLADLRQADAGLAAVAALFTRLGGLFRSPASASTRGCLLVNATAELAARDERIRPAAAAYRDRLRETFAAALAQAAERGELSAEVVQPRAKLLASTLMGVWLTVRIDARDASDLCDTIAREVASWGKP
ncbi:MAG TPA: helix-turn-helix domain-containing protein [Actinomycetes bacterium]|nr:helix-turn-helix domain-containing protein [Actinomycetes bacterium]